MPASFYHFSSEHADLYLHEIGFRISMRSASGAPSASSRNRLPGGLDTGGKLSSPSGRVCRPRCNYQKSFRPQQVAKCVGFVRAVSIKSSVAVFR
jgi:hypothetical protein